MIPESTQTVTVSGNMEGEEFDLGIDMSNLGAILKPLTDMYSDPTLACIREYSANALDAHVDGGNPDPILVFTPGHLRSSFTVQDFGVGLTLDEIKNIYTKYGRSTKTDSNETIGSWGLGSKSALTYTNAFTVTAVKDGMRAALMIARGDNHVGRVKVIDHSPTDEPNGVTIDIPVAGRDDFLQKCDRFFRFWQPGTVLVNGKEPTTIEKTEIASQKPITFDVNGNEVTGSVDVYQAADLDSSFIVMGNVAYPVENTYYNRAKFVAYVPIGSVVITPSREALFYEPGGKTEKTVTQVKKIFSDGLDAAAQREVDAQSNFMEAWQAIQKWSRIIGHTNLTYRGHPFVSGGISVPFLRYAPGGYRSERASGHGYFNLGEVLRPNVLFITGFKQPSVPGVVKSKAKAYSENEAGGDFNVFLFIDELPDNPWLESVNQVPYSEIAKIRMSANVSSGRKEIRGSWERYTVYGNVEEITELDTSLPIVYVSGTESVNGWRKTPGNFTNLLPSDVQFLRLGTNRWAKFTRQFPMAEHIKEYIKRRLKEEAGAFTTEQKDALKLDSRVRKILKSLSGFQIDDPEISKWIALASTNVSTTQYNEVVSLATKFYVNAEPLERETVGRGDVFSKYPLLLEFDSYTMPIPSAVAEYINLKYNHGS